jgi:hypothetical protein
MCSSGSTYILHLQTCPRQRRLTGSCGKSCMPATQDWWPSCCGDACWLEPELANGDSMGSICCMNNECSGCATFMHSLLGDARPSCCCCNVSASRSWLCQDESGSVDNCSATMSMPGPRRLLYGRARLGDNTVHVTSGWVKDHAL